MGTTAPGRDEPRLTEMGDKQALNRASSALSNLAIISILAGAAPA